MITDDDVKATENDDRLNSEGTISEAEREQPKQQILFGSKLGRPIPFQPSVSYANAEA